MKRFQGKRRGFAMLLLAVAAASVCTVTVSTQSSGSVYETQAVRQQMREHQSRWLVESFSQLGLASACDPGLGVPLIQPTSYAYQPRGFGFTAGANADISTSEKFQLRTTVNFSLASSPLNQDLRITMYADPYMTGRPIVDREVNLHNVALQPVPGAASRSRVAVSPYGPHRRAGWSGSELGLAP